MKKLLILLAVLVLLAGCAAEEPAADIAATTLPVYEFTTMICQGTPLRVTRLITESVSCLHDYTLNVSQVRAAEAAGTIVISGAGLEDFMADLFPGKDILDSSDSIHLLEAGHTHHHHEESDHHHEEAADPHFWLDPDAAMQMARNICAGLQARYPQYSDIFARNTEQLLIQLAELKIYGQETLQNLSCRQMITFHDGFSYFAHAFELTILDAVEEESGAEASAKELIHLIEEVRLHNLPAVFTEKNGSASAAQIISRETGCGVFALDMAMSGESYFTAMYNNIQTIKEALG